MTERQWELYRLSVMTETPESPYKASVIAAIKHKLMILDLHENASVPEGLSHFHRKNAQPQDIRKSMRAVGPLLRS